MRHPTSYLNGSKCRKAKKQRSRRPAYAFCLLVLAGATIWAAIFLSGAQDTDDNNEEEENPPGN